jgi:hypothetical protein
MLITSPNPINWFLVPLCNALYSPCQAANCHYSEYVTTKCLTIKWKVGGPVIKKKRIIDPCCAKGNTPDRAAKRTANSEHYGIHTYHWTCYLPTEPTTPSLQLAFNILEITHRSLIDPWSFLSFIQVSDKHILPTFNHTESEGYI